MIRKVEVVPPDRNWYNLFQAESQQLSVALGDNSIAIYHIGSTSIDTIYAKPIIDILAEVKDIEKVEPLNTAIEALGYVSMGELGITGRRFFRKDNRGGIRTHHLHVFEVGSPQIDRHREHPIFYLPQGDKYYVLVWMLRNLTKIAAE